MNVENILYTTAGLAVGFALGLAVNVWWDRDEKDQPRVRVALSSRWQRAFVLFVVVCSLFSVAITANSNKTRREQTEQLADITTAQQQTVAAQTYCNREIVRVLNANSEIAAADRDNLRRLLAVVSQLVLNPPADRTERQTLLQTAFQEYTDTEAANAAARQPYPPPDCGR